MRRHKLQFHAIAISIICGIILLLYAFIGPKQQPSGDEVVGDRFITIDRATWGLNCNDQIRREIASLSNQPAAKDAQGRLDSAALAAQPKLATFNNVLTAVGEKCNRKLRCLFQATSRDLGVEPSSGCFKRLELGYRCFSYDQVQLRDIGQGETVTIDCHDPAATAAP